MCTCIRRVLLQRVTPVSALVQRVQEEEEGGRGDIALRTLSSNIGTGNPCTPHPPCHIGGGFFFLIGLLSEVH